MLVADPRQLVWTRQPSQVRAGEPITPPPRIELQTDGADDPNVKSIEVTVRIASGPPGGRLFGTTTVRGEGGACEFHNLRVEPPGERSEEHTSELQSRENLVCRLLLEKKKKR